MCFALLFGNILASDMVTLYSYVSTIFDFAITMCYARLCLKGTIWRQLGSVMLYEMGLFGSSVIMIWILTPVKDNDILLWMDTMSFKRHTRRFNIHQEDIVRQKSFLCNLVHTSLSYSMFDVAAVQPRFPAA